MDEYREWQASPRLVVCTFNAQYEHTHTHISIDRIEKDGERENVVLLEYAINSIDCCLAHADFL